MDFFSRSAHPLQVVGCSLARLENNSRYITFSFELELSQKNIAEAPPSVAAEYVNIANLKLGVYESKLSSEVSGVNIDLYELPEAKDALVCLRNTVLSKFKVQRDKKVAVEPVITLGFGCAVLFDPALWRWGADYLSMQCFARFQMAQSSIPEETVGKIKDAATRLDNRLKQRGESATLKDGKGNVVAKFGVVKKAKLPPPPRDSDVPF